MHLRLSQMRTVLHACLLAALLALGSAEDGARLLASKSLLNRYAVEGRDLTLQYNIYNVGSRWASKPVCVSVNRFPGETVKNSRILCDSWVLF